MLRNDASCCYGRFSSKFIYKGKKLVPKPLRGKHRQLNQLGFEIQENVMIKLEFNWSFDPNLSLESASSWWNWLMDPDLIEKFEINRKRSKKFKNRSNFWSNLVKFNQKRQIQSTFLIKFDFLIFYLKLKSSFLIF